MKFNKNNKGFRYVTEIKDRYTIGDINVKIGRSTIKMIDGFLGHIEKYKRVYSSIVKYVAFMMFLGLLPNLISWIQQIDWFSIREYMRTDAIHEIDKICTFMLPILQKIAYFTLLFVAIPDIIKANFKKNKTN